MSKPTLFATGLGTDLKRAENMNVLYESYPGEKKYISMKDPEYKKELYSGKYDLVVIDIFPTEHPIKTIMIWHAIQGAKYIGLDDKWTYYKEHYAPYMDFIIAAGTGGIDFFNQCTKVPKEKILALGMPRTDRYFGVKKGDGHTGFDNKRVYFYAPTFRSWSDPWMPQLDWEYLDRELTNDEVLIVKPHPYGTIPNSKNMNHIQVIDRMEPSVNYLYDCDVVITDYSSIY